MQMHPEEYLLLVFVRFIKGAYLAIPFFYLLFRISKRMISVSDEKVMQLAFFFGSMAFSSVTWLATILGAISIIWNSSNNFLMSTIVFPAASLLGAFLLLLWLAILRIVIPGEQKTGSVSKS